MSEYKTFGEFDIRKLCITLNQDVDDVSTEDPLLIHELVHYVLAVSSPETIKLILYWAVKCQIVSEFLTIIDNVDVKVKLPFKDWHKEDSSRLYRKTHRNLYYLYLRQKRYEDFVYCPFDSEELCKSISNYEEFLYSKQVEFDEIKYNGLNIGGIVIKYDNPCRKFEIPIGRQLIEHNLIKLLNYSIVSDDKTQNTFKIFEIENKECSIFAGEYIEDFSLTIAIDNYLSSDNSYIFLINKETDKLYCHGFKDATIIVIYILSLMIDEDIINDNHDLSPILPIDLFDKLSFCSWIDTKEFYFIDAKNEVVKWASPSYYLSKILKAIKKYDIGLCEDGNTVGYANKILNKLYNISIDDYLEKLYDYYDELFESSHQYFSDIKKKHSARLLKKYKYNDSYNFFPSYDWIYFFIGMLVKYYLNSWIKRPHLLFNGPHRLLYDKKVNDISSIFGPVIRDKNYKIYKNPSYMGNIYKNSGYYYDMSESIMNLFESEKLHCSFLENYNQTECNVQNGCYKWIKDDKDNSVFYSKCPHKILMERFFGDLDKFFTFIPEKRKT